MTGLLLLALVFFCWGSWGTTQKAAGRWRHEFYYWDFSIGVFACMAAVAFTFGSMNSSELTFQDNFLIATYRNMVFAIAAGALFNVANILLVSAVSVAGLSVSFPGALGIATVIAVVWNFVFQPGSSAVVPLGGAVLILAAIVLLAFAYTSYRDALAEVAKKAALQIDPRTKQAKKTRGPSVALGIALATAAGVLMGFVPPIVEASRDGDGGVGPYGIGVLFASGMLFTTVIFSPFVVNFPVRGNPVAVFDFLKGNFRQHTLGILGGILWAAGLAASLVVSGSPAGAAVGPAYTSALTYAPALLAILLGALVWKEFQGSSERVRSLMWGVVVLYAAGVAMISMAARVS